MGEVFEGFDESLQRRVALKAIRADRVSKEARARLLREARILSQLSDPRICTIHGWLEDDRGDFLVLELIEGETLDQVIARGVPSSEALRLVAEVAEVLVASHRRGVIHRDLKPSNLMLTQGGRIKVLDFGVSSVEATGGEEVPTLPGDGFETRAGKLVGTVAYMSPEQARGERATAASDIWALGLVLEELLTGLAPDRDATSPELALERLRRGERPSVEKVPAELEPLLLDMTAASPEARPTAAGVLDRLATIRAAPRTRLRRLVLAAVLAGAAGLGLYHTSRLTQERNLARAAEREATAARLEAEQVVELLESMFELAGPRQTEGETITVREILDRGAERVATDLGDQPAVRARLLATIGTVATQLGLIERADGLLSGALAAAELAHGPDSIELAAALHRLARLRREQSRHAEALESVERALEIARSPGGDSRQIAELLLERARNLRDITEPEQAEASIAEAVAMLERLEGPSSPALIEPLAVLASARRQQRRFQEALEIHERLHQLDTSSRLTDRGSRRYNHGITLSHLGRWDEAEPILLEARALWVEAYGEVHHEVAKVELALATIDREREHWEAAEARYESAIAIWSSTHGADSPNVAFGLNNLGNLLLRTERVVEAEPLFARALANFEQHLGPDHPNVSMTLANRGRALAYLGRSTEAIPLLERAVRIDERLGPDNPDLGWDLIFLAQARWKGDRSAEAPELARRGLGILERSVGLDHPEIAGVVAQTPELFEAP